MRAVLTLIVAVLLTFLPPLSAQSPADAQSAPLTPRDSETYTISDLFSRADTVVLANVLAGDTKSYDIPLFKAQVIQAFKGASNGATIYFSPFAGMQVDMQYFLFLRNAPTAATPRPGPNHGFGIVPYLQVFDGGYTSMPTSYQCVFPEDPKHHCDNVVKVCTDYITLPKSIQAVPSTGPASPSNCSWVKRDAFATLLGDLIRSSQ